MWYGEFLICLFTNCVSFLVRYLLRSLIHFLVGLLPYFWDVKTLCMFWITIPYLKCVFCKYFFLVCSLLSNSLDIVVYRRFFFSFVLNTVSSLLLVHTKKVTGFSVCSDFYLLLGWNGNTKLLKCRARNQESEILFISQQTKWYENEDVLLTW